MDLTLAAACRLTSPDGRLAAAIDASGPLPRWSLQRDGLPVLAPSELGLRLADGRLLGQGAEAIGVTETRHEGGWEPPYGQSKLYDETSNEVAIRFRDPGGVVFDIVLRVFDAAAAVRYVVVENGGRPLSLSGERTVFRFPAAARFLAARDEGEFQWAAAADLNPYEHPDLTGSSDRGALSDLPITVDLGDGRFALMAESDRLHYPRAMVMPSADGGLETWLMRYPARATAPAGPGDTPEEPEFDIDEGQKTPWRVVMVADSPLGLIEMGHVVPSLATPNRLGDVAWVRPGRAFRIRKMPYVTEEGLAAVDFAARRKLDYVEYDWRWYGDGTDAGDATVPIPSLDIRKVIDYARSKGIGMIVYVDRLPAMTQLEEICRTYRDWGISGIKFGFVWEGRQSDNDFIEHMVRTCGEHGLLVNLHDDLRPAGLERTYPNYVAQEGVRGNEHFPPARHNVDLAFNRSIVGPIDYTICYAHASNQTTNAHQMALAAIYYNPLTFLYWYDEPHKYADDADWPELAFLDECPTTWDETRAIAGIPSEYVVVARRSGARWFLGAITNELSRRLTIDLGFLGAGRWRATRFRDGAWTKPAWQTPVVIETVEVTAADRLSLFLNAAGGEAIVFDPV